MARRPDPRSARRAEHLEELAALRARVSEAEDLLRAIGRGEVDAIVRQGPAGDQVFTLEGADRPYRTMVETMAEGALSLATDGAILYANARFAELIGGDLDQIIGASIAGFVAPHDAARFDEALRRAADSTTRERLQLRRADGGCSSPRWRCAAWMARTAGPSSRSSPNWQGRRSTPASASRPARRRKFSWA